MLTKAQSLGHNFGSPVKPWSDNKSNKSGSNPTTPSRTPGRMQSALHSPTEDIFFSPTANRITVVSGDMGVEQRASPKVRRTYGQPRTFVEAEQKDSTTQNDGGLDEEMGHSYAELRKKYEIDNADTAASGSGNLMAVSRFCL